MLTPKYSPTTWGVARIDRRGGGRSRGGVGIKRSKCNCGEFGYQMAML